MRAITFELTSNKLNKKRILAELRDNGEMEQSEMLNSLLSDANFTTEQKNNRADIIYKREVKRSLLELCEDGIITDVTDYAGTTYSL